MKLFIFLIGLLLLGQESIAQSSTLTVEALALPNLTSAPCSAGNTGKIYFSAMDNKVCYCLDAAYTVSYAHSKWERTNNDIYYTKGWVALSKSTPAYPLDVHGNGHFNSTLLSDAKLALNSTTPPVEKLHITDGDMAIRSTADTKVWQFAYVGSGSRFEIAESGFPARMYINNGGHLGIGTAPSANVLTVNGGGAFSGNVSTGNLGILHNSTATQLKLYTGSVTTPSSNFFIPVNECKTTGFSFPAGTLFSGAPSVAIGNKITGGGGSDDKLTITVENVSNNGGTIRFCNSTQSGVSVLSHSYTLIAIGQ